MVQVEGCLEMAALEMARLEGSGLEVAWGGEWHG